MSTTPRGFRYPASTDTPDVPRDIHNLATDIDNQYISASTFGGLGAAGLPGRRGRVTGTGDEYLDNGTAWVLSGGVNVLRSSAPIAPVFALPGSPIDGQEIFYMADAGNGIVWHLKYRAGSGSAFKWEFIGGSFLAAEYDNAEATPNGGYGLSNGPQVTIPLQGDYKIDFGAFLSSTQANFIYMSFDFTTGTGSHSASDVDAAIYVTTVVNAFGNGAAVARSRHAGGLTAGSTVVTRYKSSSPNGSAASRWLRVRPIRVG